MCQTTPLLRRRVLQGACLLPGLLVLGACGPASQATPASAAASPTAAPTTGVPSPTASATPGNTPVLVTIAMMSTTTGWGLVSQQGVFRTADGGLHWKDVSPRSVSRIAQGVFVTDALAWVVVSLDNAGATELFRTTDGGQTWQQMKAVQDGPAFMLTFIDAQHGWMMASPDGAAAGSEPVDIFRTTNGGASWVKVQSGSFSANNQPGALPPGGDKSGLSFRDASNGWVTGTIPVDNFTFLYVTHDGGLTWQRQNLPPPQGMTTAYFTLQPPTFFNASDGVLPVSVGAPNANYNSLDIYVTHDGGATWQSTALLPNERASDFINARYGWATDGATLYATSDGGQHWMLLPASRAFNGVTAPDFVSPTVGWAISDPSGNPDDSILLKTTDGGRIWAPITPLM